jgi:repressor LexA
MLTERQKEVLDFIKAYIAKQGISPTLTEINNHFNLGSSSAAHQHVEALQRKGYLKKLPYQSRAISIVEETEDTKEIAILGRIALGEPIENYSEPETIKVPRLLLCGSGRHYALESIGDSMNLDGINDGDLLIIQETNAPNNGDTVVAQTRDYKATLKRFYDHDTKIELRPKSSNPNNKPQSYAYGDIQIQGKLCGLIRRNV